MNAQRGTAFLIIAVESAAAGLLFEVWSFPVLAGVLALAGAWGGWQADPPKSTRQWGALLLLAGFLVKWFVAPYAPPGLTATIPNDLRYVVYQCATAFQVSLLFLRSRDGVSPLFPMMGAVALVATGAVIANAPVHIWFGGLCMGYMALTSLFYVASRKRAPGAKDGHHVLRWTLIAVAVLFAIGQAVVVAVGAHRYQRQLDEVFMKIVAPAANLSSVGFSDNAGLGSVARMQGQGPQRVGLRVFADSQPGYLRGKAYTNFNGTRWSADPKADTLSPVQRPPAHLPIAPMDRVFTLAERGGSPALEALDIQPVQSYGGVIFATMDALHVSADIPVLRADAAGVVEAGPGASLGRYLVFRPADRTTRNIRPGHPPNDDTCLAVPEDLDPRITALAETVFAGCATTAEKMSAVERYFIQNYTYEFGIQIPGGEDPLTYFLIEKPAAHCEYFAAGSTILLRLAGVPCRYVTGFVTTEYNRYGGYYVARNKDAHAWVEAYDEARGAWVLVESTPPAGRPEAVNRWAVFELWDYLKQSMGQLTASFGKDMRSFFLQCLHLIRGLVLFLVTSVVGWVLIALTATVMLRRIRRRRKARVAAAPPPEVAAFHALLRRMDRHLRKQGFPREEEETPHQFAARIEAECEAENAAMLVAWYRDYGVARFGGEADAEALAETLDEMGVPATKRTRRV